MFCFSFISSLFFFFVFPFCFSLFGVWAGFSFRLQNVPELWCKCVGFPLCPLQCPSHFQSMRGLGIFLPNLTWWANYFLSACKIQLKTKTQAEEWALLQHGCVLFLFLWLVSPRLPFHSWSKNAQQVVFRTGFQATLRQLEPRSLEGNGQALNIQNMPDDRLMFMGISQTLQSRQWMLTLAAWSEMGKGNSQRLSVVLLREMIRLFLLCRVCSGALHLS